MKKFITLIAAIMVVSILTGCMSGNCVGPKKTGQSQSAAGLNLGIGISGWKTSQAREIAEEKTDQPVPLETRTIKVGNEDGSYTPTTMVRTDEANWLTPSGTIIETEAVKPAEVSKVLKYEGSPTWRGPKAKSMKPKCK